MSDKYIIRNCNSFNGYCNWCRDKQKHCKDITDCVLKQIVELCKKQKNTCIFAVVFLADRILQLLDIEEVE